MSGWKVRNRDEWTLLGKQNPQKPQMFNTIVAGDGDDMDIQKGDVVAARCTMVNHLGMNKKRIHSSFWREI